MTTGVMQMRLTDPTCSPAVREEGTLKSGESSPLLHLMKSSNFIPAESKMSHSTAAQVSQQASLDLWELPPYNEAESLFGPDLRILSVKTGRKEHAYISFELHLSEADFSGLKYWKESKSANSLKDIQTSFCISIACYRREDLLDDLNLLSSRVSVLSSSWPQHPASSSLLIKTLTSELSVPLSPPIYLTPDKLVDISPWLHLGGNQFGILQQGMDDYAFVILLHRPTRKQLQQVSAARLNDLAWQHFLDGFSAPIEYIPLRSLTLTANPEK
ncbi:hypothetical protein CPB83DRAFT_678834 [Crepidotus variabilis]|uniref:Uncharacterized protein n=1 Tax=Crepidotus variabilis TaxID=179855 RepID=A0A9P6EP48_9AGAR|nr:hypothetical protein CPB83DRAFT_678834 [Crepidotus variabilis]